MTQIPFIHTGRRPGSGVPWINRNHPLAEALRAAYYPAAASGSFISNLADPGSGDLNINGGGAFLVPTQEGLALGTSGTATNLYATGLASPRMQPNGRFSAFFRCQYTGNASTNTAAAIFGVSFSGAGTVSPFWSWQIAPNTATAANHFGIAYASSNTTFINTSIISAPPALVANRMASGGVVALGTRSSGVNQVLYQNGVGALNNSVLDIGFYGSAPQITIGNPNGGGTNCSANVNVAYLWAAVLTPADMEYMDANPYSLLLWPSDYIMAELVGRTIVPGTPTPSNKSIFWSPLTVGLGGAAAAERWLRRRKDKMRQLRGE